ncbi:hypothetical protein AB0Q95_40060 [Streptomyces sp. NPDC059900]|uniref:hypothetical protein n=1 Tax=Streptomyces sp. NPDC059900 TaxID=3155816 RepID=UPI00341C6F44
MNRLKLNYASVKYVSVASVAALAVLTGPAATGAGAATPPPAPAPGAGTPGTAAPGTTAPGTGATGTGATGNPAPGAPATAAPRPTLTAKSTASSVRAWQDFHIYGVARHMRPGTRVTLQQLQGKRWVALPASVYTARSGAYNMRVKLGWKGRNSLRVAGGGALSPVLKVTVR